MNVNRVGPSGQDPIKKKEAPNPKDFEEHKKIEKTHEVDPEEQKKSKKYVKEEDESSSSDKEKKIKTSSPFEVYPKGETLKKEKPSKPDTSLPKSPGFFEETSLERPNEKDEAKRPQEKDEMKEKPGHVQFTDFHSTQDKAHGQFQAPPAKEKIPQHKKPLSEPKKAVHHRKPFEEEVLPQPQQISQPNLVIPPDIQAQASQLVGSTVSFQHSDIQRLFTQVVGTVMVMLRDGITTTEVHLNRPEFENSILYGTTISVEHYKTAPDSFNIRLRGTPQAVNVYNDNLSQLVSAFQKPGLKFQVSRIDVEIDSSMKEGLFRRKGRKKDTEAGM